MNAIDGLKRSKYLLIAVSAALAVSFGFSWTTGLPSLEREVRANIYVATAAAAAALFAFLITGLTILVALGDGPRLKRLRSGGTFRLVVTVFHHSSFMMLAATVVPIVALAIDNYSRRHRFMTEVFFAVEVAAYGLVLLCLWVLGQLVYLAEEDNASTNTPEPPRESLPQDPRGPLDAPP